MIEQSDVTTSPATTLPALAPKANHYSGGGGGGSFQSGTDGGTVRPSWARTQTAMGFGWNAMAGTPYAIGPGYRAASEAQYVSTVAHEILNRNSTLTAIVETMVTNALGTGLTLSAKPDAMLLGLAPEAARTLSHQIETAWRAWSSNPRECDATGRSTIDELATTAFRTYVLSGEVVATIDFMRCRDARSRTKVCLLDPRQLDVTITKATGIENVVSGVSFDVRGRLIGYYLRDMPLGSLPTQPQAKLVQAFTSWGRARVIHLFEKIDARQVRGLSPLVAALTPSNERESLAEFSLTGHLLHTQFAVTLESDLPPTQAIQGLDSSMSGDVMGGYLDARNAFYGAQKVDLGPGKVNALPPGDKLRMNKVQNGGETFEAFDRSLVRSAARAGGLSFEEVSGDYSKTSFSASRLALAVPHRLAMRRRKVIVEAFYQTIFEAWLDEAVATGVVMIPDEAPDYLEYRACYSKAKWRGIGMIEPDRKKTVEATGLELELGLTTFEDALAERGIDMDTHLESLKAERVRMRDAGLDRPVFPGSTTTQVRVNEELPPKDEPAEEEEF